MSTEITFAPLQPSHLPGAMRMSADCGWPHRIEDWAFVAGISRGVVGLQGDQVVATALATPFGPVAMANLIIVDAALRGRGLGREIMRRAMAGLSPQAWQLVATQEGLPLYEGLGFEATSEIRQHQGPVQPDGLDAAGADWAGPDDLMALVALDGQASGLDRHALYAALQETARFAVLRDGAAITGFAALRPFGRGEVAGPIVAANPGDAKRLLSFLFSRRSGQFLRVDTDAGTGLAPWLETQGLAHVGGGVQMRRGAPPPPPAGPCRIYGLASQALG